LNFLEDTVKGAQHPPLLDPSLLWPWSPISATAELLLCEVVGLSCLTQLLTVGPLSSL